MPKRDKDRAFRRAFSKLRYIDALGEVYGCLTPGDVVILHKRGFTPKYGPDLDRAIGHVSKGESGNSSFYYDKSQFKGLQLRDSRRVL